MTFEYSPIVIPLIVCSIILIGLFRATFNFRRENSATIFTGLLISLFVWCVGFIFEIMGVELSTKLFWANIQFLGILFIPIFLLLLTINVTGQGKKLIPLIRYMTIFAIISIVVIWSNDLHQFFRGTPSIDRETASFSILVNDYGFWFYFIQAPVAYLSYILNFILLIQALRFSEKTYRMQARLLLATMLLPLSTDALYILGYSPIPNFNITAVTFSFSGLFIGWALFKYKMFDIGPMAFQLVIQNLQDGVIVLDIYERIISLNDAAFKIIGTNEEDAIGESIYNIIPFWSELKHDEMNIYTFKENETNKVERHYEILISPIWKNSKTRIGRVITFRNVTQQIKLHQKTKVLASTDSLTNVLNRRAFFENMDDNLEIAIREKTPLSFVMFDIDDFKNINDKYGHSLGDKALVKVAEACQENLRSYEVLGRYGGDEFCILLPKTTPDQTLKIADRIFKAISSIQLITKDEKIGINISMGVASFSGKTNATLEEIINKADKALYKAKHAGKNQIVNLNME